MRHNEPMPRAVPSSEIPDKLYFRIGDVAKLCAVPPYVLRFWESEFPQLKPNKGGSGQRLYRRKDVEMALTIKRLLYDEGYTIPGARQVFKAEQQRGAGAAPQLTLAIEPTRRAAPKDAQRLRALRQQLEDLHTMLGEPVARGDLPTGKTLLMLNRRARSLTTMGPRHREQGMADLFDTQNLPSDAADQTPE